MIFFGDGWCKWKIRCFLYLPFGLFINKSTYSCPAARQQNNFLILLHFYLNSFLFIFWNCFLSKFPSSLKGILYTSSIAPLIIFGVTRSIYALPNRTIWSGLCCAILFISAVAWLINFGATFLAWLTTSVPT